MTIVLADGVFDLFHIAHLRHLQEARGMGDELWVGVTEDRYVKKGSGRPIIPLEERMELLKGLSCVSGVVSCISGVDAMEKVNPHIFCKGSDYARKGLLDSEIDYCKEHGIRIKFTHENPQTTSAIIERIKCISL